MQHKNKHEHFASHAKPISTALSSLPRFPPQNSQYRPD